MSYIQFAFSKKKERESKKTPDKFYVLNRTRERKELMKITFRYSAREVSDLYSVPCFTHDSGRHQTEKSQNFSISCDIHVKLDRHSSF